MFKSIGKYLGIGFLFGLGFAVAFATTIYLFQKSEYSDYQQLADESKTNYLKGLISDIENKENNICNGIEGIWVGEFIEQDGAQIRTWELMFHTDGTMEGDLTYKSITEETKEYQKGTWECSHSILFADVIIDNEHRRRWTYLLLHNDNNELIYAHIGDHRVGNVYRAFRQKL
jgi:hypothetical protein